MNCATENVIYLISCKRCGVQYVGETGQKLRNRFNNHRNQLRQLSNLYLYQHFTSDGHSEEDIDQLKKLHVHLTLVYTLNSWREKTIGVCTVYLNDNVRKVGNVSKCGGCGYLI